MILTILLFILLIIHINLQQSDEHPKQNTEKLQVGTSFPHLVKYRYTRLIALTGHLGFILMFSTERVKANQDFFF